MADNVLIVVPASPARAPCVIPAFPSVDGWLEIDGLHGGSRSLPAGLALKRCPVVSPPRSPLSSQTAFDQSVSSTEGVVNLRARRLTGRRIARVRAKARVVMTVSGAMAW